MKPFIIALYVVFVIAMASGLTIAYRTAEGLVEPDYYARQARWFSEKAIERHIGFRVQPPEALARGGNEVTFIVTQRGRPLEKAVVALFIGKVSDKEHDLTIAMREKAPGIYTAQATVPSTGKWLVRMELSNDQLKTTRSWFYDIQ